MPKSTWKLVWRGANQAQGQNCPGSSSSEEAPTRSMSCSGRRGAQRGTTPPNPALILTSGPIIKGTDPHLWGDAEP